MNARHLAAARRHFDRAVEHLSDPEDASPPGTWYVDWEIGEGHRLSAAAVGCLYWLTCGNR